MKQRVYVSIPRFCSGSLSRSSREYLQPGCTPLGCALFNGVHQSGICIGQGCALVRRVPWSGVCTGQGCALVRRVPWSEVYIGQGCVLVRGVLTICFLCSWHSGFKPLIQKKLFLHGRLIPEDGW